MAPGQPLNIPGYYFDPQRGRYFKLEAHHNLATGAKHSIQSYAAETRATKKRRKKEEREAAMANARVTRSPLLQASQAWKVKTEVGGPRADLNAHTKRLASVFNNQSDTLLQATDVWDEITHIMKIKHFDYDATTRTIIAGAEGYRNYIISAALGDLQAVSNTSGLAGHLLTTPVVRRWIERTDSSITSVNINPHRTVVITTSGERRPGQIHFSPLRAAHEVDAGDDRIYLNPPAPLTPSPETSVWASAPNPFEDAPESVAVGTSASIMHYKRNITLETWDSECFSEPRRSDPRALEWLSPQTFAVGFRSGYINLYDIRARAYSQRLCHRSTVTGIKRADSDCRLVVAGTQSSMHTYDLRMFPHSKRNRQSSAYIVFDYENELTYPIGLDVHRDSGLIAAAQDNGIVQLYSMRDGAKIRKLDQRVTRTTKAPEPVPCLRFVEEVTGEDEGRTKLLGSAGTRILQWM